MARLDHRHDASAQTWGRHDGQFATDTFMFTEVNYGMGNNSAQMAQGGVIYNMITRSGTNQFHADFRIMATNHRLQANNLSPEVRARLLENVPARVLAVSPNPRNGILKIVDAGLTLSGPIVRNKLWFVTTGKLNPLQDVRLGSYEADGSQMVGNSRMRNWSFKISGQVSQNNQLHFSHNYNRKGAMTQLTASETSSVFGEARATVVDDSRIKVTQGTVRFSRSIAPNGSRPSRASAHAGICSVSICSISVPAPWRISPSSRIAGHSGGFRMSSGCTRCCRRTAMRPSAARLIAGSPSRRSAPSTSRTIWAPPPRASRLTPVRTGHRR